MPFSCKFQLNNGAITEQDEVIFEAFVDSAFGEFHSENVEIAKVVVNGKPTTITSTCPCFPSSKNEELEKGTRIFESTIIGHFSANGEDIPYDKPYAKVIFHDTL